MTETTHRTSLLGQLSDLYKSIRQTYLRDRYPWVIGYSGGKDSTTALQLVWYALAELPPDQRKKPVFIISTDTLVETPVIVDRNKENIERINREAQKQGLPFQAHNLSPILDDTFWVNLLGRGYPAPNSGFRWCTERLKINPSNRFILNKVAEHGEVILVLGSRRGESSTRDQVLQMHRFTGTQLARHGQLPGAWVYMPIEEFSTDDIWTYLLQVPNPWGGDNRQLAALYRSAQDGECPLVVDSKTSSCGGSRFGCWVCTVVTKDKSMEAMIDSGAEWMIPLLDYRDWLASTQDPEVKPQQREFRGRDGRVKITDDGRLRYRTYTLDFSKQMLRRLLEAQKEIQAHDPAFRLISIDELREIRRIWLMERQDWGDSLPEIFREVTGQTIAWEQNDVYAPGKLEAVLLAELGETYDVPQQLVQKLLDAEWQHYGMRRRATIHKTVEKIFNEDWRSREEVHEEMARRQAAATEATP
ncbi:MAG TPA: DNA phosphorothioation system sulfurtransferase DndC [Caldilineaceae bacterium]|nr:DNA phosphorothioation system sulfurtransferase DndC [Caldilineaceae bacterium]